MVNEREKLRQWHSAFCSAMKLELWEQKSILEYHSEYTLNTKPLLIDLLIIKKMEGQEIENEIGNHISYFVFLQIPDIRLKKKSPGLYYIGSRNLFQIQVIVVRELGRKNHVWLHSLSGQLDAGQLQNLVGKMKDLHGKEERALADSVISLAMQTNMRRFVESKGELEMCKELWDFFKPEIDDEMRKAEAEGENKGMIKVYREFGISVEEIARRMNLSVEEVERIQ